jgi:streptomycin 6-kinase
MVRSLLTVAFAVMVVVGGGEGGLTGVAKKSAVRERVGGGAGFLSGWMGDGGCVEKGEAKKALVLDVEEESEMDDVMISENVDDNDEVLEPDDLDRENEMGFSVDAVIRVAQQNISSCHE